jgi:hypothetical protein
MYSKTLDIELKTADAMLEHASLISDCKRDSKDHLKSINVSRGDLEVESDENEDDMMWYVFSYM